MVKTIKKIFSLDLRSLALLRVSVGIVLITDLAFRARNMIAHYTDAGVAPRAFMITYYQEKFLFSLHFWSGLWEFQAILFLAAALAAGALVLGYKTRLATFLSWLLQASLISRNPFVCQGGDVLLNLTLFWGFFLPWGRLYSWDSWDESEPSETDHFSAGSIALVLQICLVYWVSALVKAKSPAWWSDGTALYYTLHFERLTTSLAPLLWPHPQLMKGMTHLVFWGEALGPLLFLVPFKNGVFRTMGVLFVIAFHANLRAFMDVGIFTYAGSVTALVFLPADFWEKLWAWLKSEKRTKLTIVYDDGCGFCKTSAGLIKEFFLFPECRLSPVSGEAALPEEMERENSWIVRDHKGVKHHRFEGFRAIVRASPWVFWADPFLKLPPVRWVGDRVYRFVASHRRRVCPIGAPPFRHSEPDRRGAGFWVVQTVVSILLAVVFWWNLWVLLPGRIPMPSVVEQTVYALRLHQRWEMFSLPATTGDGWMVIPARLKDGSVVDLYRNGAPVVWDKPRSVSSTYDGDRWAKFLTLIYGTSYQGLRENYGRYLSTRWNKTHPDDRRVMALDMYLMHEATPPYPQPETAVPMLLLRQSVKN